MKQNLILTDHAYRRICQRVIGIEDKNVLQRVLTPEILKGLETFKGSGTFPFEHYSLVFKNYSLITVVDENNKKDKQNAKKI